MKKRSISGLAMLCMLFAATTILRAEVKTEEKNQFKLEGGMGRIMGFFGGKAAKEGVISTIAVKGNRKMTTSENSGEIIDLDEQKIYNLDFKKKKYEVVTFDEMRRRLQEAQERASKAAKEDNAQEREAKQPPEKQMEFDFSLKESGQKRTINGYDCREVVMTITAREKGKTLEQSGGMVMTSHIWLGPNIPALKEISDFDRRYAQALQGPQVPGGSAEQMAMAMAFYPAMKNMIGKMETESVNMDGAQILTEMVMESVKSPEQMAQSQSQSQENESSGMPSVRGLGGMLGRRLARKKESEGEAGKPSNRSTILTVNHEILKVSTGISDADLAIPTGFKEK